MTWNSWEYHWLIKHITYKDKKKNPSNQTNKISQPHFRLLCVLPSSWGNSIHCLGEWSVMVISIICHCNENIVLGLCLSSIGEQEESEFDSLLLSCTSSSPWDANAPSKLCQSASKDVLRAVWDILENRWRFHSCPLGAYDLWFKLFPFVWLLTVSLTSAKCSYVWSDF